MKTITFRKKWVKAISKLPKELRNDAIIAVFNFLATGEKDHPETAISNLVWDVEHDIIKSAEQSEKARQRREQKKAEKAQQQAEQQPVAPPAELSFDSATLDEYDRHPELYMFDGFMSYLISRAGMELLPAVPDDMNVVTLLCFFRNWVIDNGKLGEMTKLNSFCGLFRHALPSLIKKMAA